MNENSTISWAESPEVIVKAKERNKQVPLFTNFCFFGVNDK